MDTGKNLSFPLGIDLVELKKAKSFYNTHKHRLNSFFSSKEISYIQKALWPHEALGILLAAKEAVFKALPRTGAGIAAFRNIEIQPERGGRFSFCSVKTGKRSKLEFTVLKNKRYVIVQCAGI